METQDFRDWMARMGYSNSKAADALGLSLSSIELYRRGTRKDDGRPVIIPRTVALACWALENGCGI